MTWQRYNKNLRKSALLAEYFSFWTDLTVFLLITAMVANFYRYIVALPLMAVQLLKIQPLKRASLLA